MAVPCGRVHSHRIPRVKVPRLSRRDRLKQVEQARSNDPGGGRMAACFNTLRR